LEGGKYMASVVETVLFGSEEGSVISSEELQDNAKKQKAGTENRFFIFIRN
jgi:hypothetical protein